MLIVYFSQFGRTRAAAKEMQKLTGGTLAELKPVQPYPKRYDQLIDLAKEEIRRNFHPEIQPLTVDLNDYDTVFVGYPTWWYQEPMIIDSFFATYDLADKSIIPFTTSGSTPIEEGLPILEKVVTAAHAQITASLTANSKRDIKKFMETHHFSSRWPHRKDHIS